MKRVSVEIIPNIGAVDSTLEMLDWTIELMPFIVQITSSYHNCSTLFGSKRFCATFCVETFARNNDNLKLFPFTITMREKDFILWKLRWLPRPLFRGGFAAVVQ